MASLCTPPGNVYRTQNNLILKFTLQGINSNDIAIDIENNKLTLSGEVKFEEVSLENLRRI